MGQVSDNSDLSVCPHCGAPVRRAMIRCRECDGIVGEDVGEDFVLADQVTPNEARRRCRDCGAEIDPELGHCPQCASNMLDGMLGGASSRPDNEPNEAETASRMLDSLLSGVNTDEDAESAAASQMLDGLLGGCADAPGKPAAGPSRKRFAAAGEPRARAAASGATTKEEGPSIPNEAWRDRSGPDSRGPAERSRVRDRAAPTAKPPAGEEDIFNYLNDDTSAVGDAPTTRQTSSAPTAPHASSSPAAPAEEAPSGIDAACEALIASLSSDNADLRCQSAEALGTMKNSQAMAPLERLMADPEVRVRRAAAEALIQLGHPKGAALRNIASAAPATAARSPAAPARKSPPRVRRSMSFNFGGGGLLNAGKFLLGGIGILAVGWLIWNSGLIGGSPDYRVRPGDTKGLGLVKGMLKFGGSPLDGAIVEFHSSGGGQPAGRAVLTEGDMFVVRTEDGKGGFAPGLQPGDYTVTIKWPADLAIRPPRRPIPKKYQEAATSDFHVQVKEGMNDVPPYELTP